MLFKTNKVEIKLQQYKDYSMAELIARRLHKFANDKERSPDHSKLGLRFVISESRGKTTLFIASTKLRALDSGTVHLFALLAKTYEDTLKPFFSKR